MASVTQNLFEDDRLTVVNTRTSDDLPAHVKGVAQWGSIDGHPATYYIKHPSEPEKYVAVEFINDRWYTLSWFTRDSLYATRRSYVISQENNTVGLGWWNETDPAHPSYKPAITRAGYRFEPLRTATPTTTSTQETMEANTTHVEEPRIDVFEPAVQAPPPNVQTAMSANATIVSPANTPSLVTGLLGVPPPIFDGTRAKANVFWATFNRYKLLNRNNIAISNPFNRILTALSYMRGPSIDTWVDYEGGWLQHRTDPRVRGHLQDTDEALWDEFAFDFENAWKDTASVVNAEEQLSRLTMKGLEIDNYISTFVRLAVAAEFELDSKALVGRFRSGLTERVHRRILNRENLPRTLDQWKEAARKEVLRIKEIDNANFKNRPFIPRITPSHQPPAPRNDGPVPMDVDATTIPFQKLTDAERDKFRKEGRCFRCREKGHMAKNCPKNKNPKATTAEVTTTPANTDTTTPSVNATTLTKAQQIRALEDAMTEEERGEYLDQRDGGEDFYDAGL